MKKSQAKRILDAEIKAFGHRISLLVFEKDLVTSQFKEAHTAFKEYIGTARKHSDPAIRKVILKDGIIGCSSIGSDVTKSIIIHFSLGRKSIKVREKESALIENLNRQYSWLLVSAYEAYELFVKELYACMGFLDSAFWQCDDYGAINLSSIGGLKLGWFKDRVIQRSNFRFRHGACHALGRFRRAFPSILSYERVALPAGRISLYSNAVLQQRMNTLSLKLTCSLAEKLRHAIVHNHGDVESTGVLCREIGANGAERIALVAEYLRESCQQTRIWLVNDQKGMLDYRFLDLRISHVLESVGAHACLLYKACMSHFGEETYWDRHPSKEKRKK